MLGSKDRDKQERLLGEHDFCRLVGKAGMDRDAKASQKGRKLTYHPMKYWNRDAWRIRYWPCLAAIYLILTVKPSAIDDERDNSVKRERHRVKGKI